MMNNQPLVSICISYYNDKQFITDAIESVLKQTYVNFELILLNHASTDGTRDLVHSFVDKRIKHIDYPINLGAVSGLLLEKMFDLSRGKYIKFFSADDILKNDAIEALVDFMEKHQNIDFCFGDVEYINKFSETLKETWFKNRDSFSDNDTNINCLKKFFKGLSIFPYAGQMIRRVSLKKHFFDKTNIQLLDVFLWMSLLANGKNVGFIKKIVAYYRIHEGQTTGVANLELVLKRSYFESSTMISFWSKLKDVNLIKQIFSDSQYATSLSDEKYIPFIVYEYFLEKNEDRTAFEYLHEMMQENENIKALESVFQFTVNDFRKLYSKTNVLNRKKINWRKEARNIGGQLTAIQMLYLLLFKLFRFKKNKSKKFST